MKGLLWVIFGLCLAGRAVGTGAVEELTDETFEDAIKNNSVIMVKFYAPWCGHCQAFAPEYEKAAQIIKQQGKSYVLANLDATVHNNAGRKHEIQSYPTIKLFLNGTPTMYDAPRKAESVVKFIDKYFFPPSTELKSIGALRRVKASKGMRIIKRNEDYTFYHMLANIATMEYPDILPGQLVLYKDFDEGIAIFKDELTADKVNAFLALHMFPILSDISERLMDMIFKSHSRKAVMLYRKKGVETGQLDEEFRQAAKELRSADCVFVLVTVDDTWGRSLMQHFNIDAETLPRVEAVEFRHDIVRYRHEGAITGSEVKDFYAAWRNRTASRILRSEAPPATNPGPVIRLVGKTFQQEVLENELDVLVKFYAPWCGHCTEFAPIYEKIARSLSHNPHLKLCELDASKNDAPGHDIESFPTIKFFPGKNKTNVLIYPGKREGKEVAAFLLAKSSHPITLPDWLVTHEIDDMKDDL